MSETDEAMNATLRGIFANGQIQKIKWAWDETDTHSWNAEKRLRYACDLAASMNQAAKALQDQRAELYAEIELAKKKVAAADQLREIAHTTLHEQITKHNADRQTDAKLIQELQARITYQDNLIEELGGDHD